MPGSLVRFQAEIQEGAHQSPWIGRNRLQEITKILNEHERCGNAMVMPCGCMKVVNVSDDKEHLKWFCGWKGILHEAWQWLNINGEDPPVSEDHMMKKDDGPTGRGRWTPQDGCRRPPQVADGKEPSASSSSDEGAVRMVKEPTSADARMLLRRTH